MNKLKPCPFCGGTDIEIKDEGNWSYIWCGDCLMASWQLEACSVEDNVEAWNKRTIITKHDKYTFNGDWACTEHMTIVQNGENNKHIEKLLEQKNQRIEELEERIAIMMEGNGYVEEETANHPGDVFTCEDPAEGRSEHAAGGGNDGREPSDGEPDEGGGV